MKISRKFTTAGQDVYDTVKWERRSSKISGADGKTVFEMRDAEVPAGWSQLATDIVVSKYFRKAGVPQADDRGEATPPTGGDAKVQKGSHGRPTTGPERSVRQVVHRLVACWRQWGSKHGYFDSKKDAEAFYDELAWMLLNQVAAPNSPQWFNTGLNTAYGITGPAQGHWIADPTTGEASLAHDAYTHPQPHACFIQPVRDDLVNPGGIMDLWTHEARLFKYGSGTGTNFSSLRGENEPLSGGGRSSGLMSFLKIGDRAASAIKSGGTTRRAAKMVCLDVDHPDIREFVRWKVREEIKVAAMVEGMRHLPKEQRELAARMDLSLDYDFNGEAYSTVSGQNSNNSVRVNDAFLHAVERGDDWSLIGRTSGKVTATIPARDLWGEICFAAWRCADPGVQFDTTINQWHTCPQSGRINASNPCSEYMFLDNTACNLASLNLMRFYDAQRRRFDVEAYEHAIRLWTIVLEISVLMAAFPSREIAELSWKFRTLGLGYANLGAMLMQAGIPYDSDEARAVCGALTAILTGRAYAASAEMAKELGPFDGFRRNRDDMLRVIRNHRRAATGGHAGGQGDGGWEGLNIAPVCIDHAQLRGASRVANAAELLDRATTAWDDALRLGEKHGYRNAQVTVIAPTGTIGLLMDCDTTGVEPDFALTKFKKLAGGGHFKIVNQSVPAALRALGYSQPEIDDIQRHVMGTMSLDVVMPEGTEGRDRCGGLAATDTAAGGGRMTFREFLASKGYTGEELVALENELPKVFELRFAFGAWSMPEGVLAMLGLTRAAAMARSGFNGLRAMGLSRRQIDALNRAVCGTQTVEGAPRLRPEHLPVFDCANTCGPLSTRSIAPEGHIRMMAAAQPFISGAISKTINLPNDATERHIAEAYLLSWRLGLKANALYRDGCKLSQPLNTSADAETDDGAEAEPGEASPAPAHAEPALAGVQADRPAASTAAATTFSTTRPISGGDDPRPEAPTPPAARPDARPWPKRRRLPDTRRSITHRFNVAGHEGYLTVGLYDDGAPGELFITMAKEGSTIGGLMDCIGTATSVSLQYGVPLTSLVNKFAHQRFEPQGMTTNRDIPFAKSLVDYIFRWLGMQFIEGYREENAPRHEPELAARGGRSPGAGPGVEDDPPTDLRSMKLDEIKEDPSCSSSSTTSTDAVPTPLDSRGPEWSHRAGSAEADVRSGETSNRLGGELRPDRGPRESPMAAFRSEPRRGAAGATPSASARLTDPSVGAVADPARIVGWAGRSSSIAAETIVTVARTDTLHMLGADRTIAALIEKVDRIELDDARLTGSHREHAFPSHAAVNHAHASMQADAPACSNCGHITVRSGVCYKCVNCGSQNGCG